MRKKIVFIVSSYPPSISGGAVVISKICNRLAVDNEVFVIKTDSFALSMLPTEQNDVKIYNSNRNSKNIKSLFYRSLRAVITRFNRFINSQLLLIGELRIDAHLRYTSVYKTVMKINPDLIVSVSYPFFNHVILNKLKKINALRVNLYFDPFYNNEQYGLKSNKFLMRFEERIISSSDFILLPDFILSDYNNGDFNIRKESLIQFQLPLIDDNDRCESPSQTKELEKIDCLYLGTLYEDIRNPEYMFRLWSVISSHKILLTCKGKKMGNFAPDYFKNWEKKLSQKLNLGNEISYEEAKELMQKAKVLVNISNKTINQMPSKIIEYINTGKPIINFYKNSEALDVKLIDKYPLGLNIKEDFENINSNSKIVESFIIENYNKRVNKTTILKSYQEYTIENTIGLFEKLLLCEKDQTQNY